MQRHTDKFSRPGAGGTVYLEELPYRADSTALFDAFSALPGALLLDSGYPHSLAGRFDIITAEPVENHSFIIDKTTTYEDISKYFIRLAEAHARHCPGGLGASVAGSSGPAGMSSRRLVAPSEDIPFCGGLAGYLDYGIGSPLQYLPVRGSARAELHIYGWAVIQDHVLQRCHFAALPSTSPAVRKAVLDRLRSSHAGTLDHSGSPDHLDAGHGPEQGDASPPSHSGSPIGADRHLERGNASTSNDSGAGRGLEHRCPPFHLDTPFKSNMSQDSYRQALERIQRYILAGDCYQANLAQRFSATYSGDPWQAYRMLRPLAGTHQGGYMRLDESRHLLCFSPERFLRLAGRRVETRPIKGTRPRQADPAADQGMADALRLSPKDRAENLMIVDLLRNDIGRNCTPGSIRVDRLFELESYPAVHHLVSTIGGELLPERNALDLLRDSFPGGSITGAPKRRAMQIIDELEPQGRGPYCGSMLYISADGRMDSNIAIRSLVCEGGDIHCWGGGGIVADSAWEEEYRETLDKVGYLIEALEQTLPGE